MKTSNYFYNKFVNEENLKSIANLKIQRKFYNYGNTIQALLFVSVTLVTFVGYNFENLFAIGVFIGVLLCFLGSLCLAIRLILLDKKYHVFKRHLYSILFLSLNFILAIPFYISAIFTTKFTSYPNNSFEIDINLAFFLLIYVPLFVGYLIFDYYAAAKCFRKYTIIGMRFLNKNNKNIQDEHNENETNDVLKSMINNGSFYNKYVNEDNLKNIGDTKVQQTFYRCGAQIPLNLFVSVLWATISEYQFEQRYHILFFVFAILFLLLALFYAVRLIILDKKHHVFKKHWYPYIFISIYFILSIVFYVLAYFKITSTSQSEEEIDLNLNYLFFWLIYTPLLLIYSSFCKRAFNSCFLKYTKGADNLYRNIDNEFKDFLNDQTEEEVEDDTSESNE